jgi:hypothetical protein
MLPPKAGGIPKPRKSFTEYIGRARDAAIDAERVHGKDSDAHRKAMFKYHNMRRQQKQSQDLASEQLQLQAAEEARGLGFMDEVMLGAGQGQARVAKSAGSVANMLAAPFGSEPGDKVYEWGESREKMALDVTGQPVSLVDDPKQLVDPKWWVRNLSEQSAYYVPAVLAGIATGGSLIAAGATAGILESGADYEELIREGVGKPEAAARASLSIAIIGALNALPLRSILKGGAAKGVIKSAASKTIMQGIKKGFMGFIKEGASEALEEPLQLLTRELGRISGGELASKMVDTLKSSLDAFVLGGVMGGATTIAAETTARKEHYKHVIDFRAELSESRAERDQAINASIAQVESGLISREQMESIRESAIEVDARFSNQAANTVLGIQDANTADTAIQFPAKKHGLLSKPSDLQQRRQAQMLR